MWFVKSSETTQGKWKSNAQKQSLHASHLKQLAISSPLTAESLKEPIESKPNVKRQNIRFS